MEDNYMVKSDLEYMLELFPEAAKEFREEERNAGKMEVAINMKAIGYEVSYISEVTGFTPEQIGELK